MRASILAAVGLLALLPSAVCLAQTGDGPTRKPGWWEMQMTILSGASEPVHRTVHICTDRAVDKVQSPLHVNMLGRFCRETTMRSATGWTVSGSCESSDARITQEAVSTGDLNTRYHVDVITHMSSPPSSPDKQTNMSIEARWAGECPSGNKPGDTEGYPPHGSGLG